MVRGPQATITRMISPGYLSRRSGLARGSGAPGSADRLRASLIVSGEAQVSGAVLRVVFGGFAMTGSAQLYGAERRMIVILAFLPLLLLVRTPRRQQIPAAADD